MIGLLPTSLSMSSTPHFVEIWLRSVPGYGHPGFLDAYLAAALSPLIVSTWSVVVFPHRLPLVVITGTSAELSELVCFLLFLPDASPLLPEPVRSLVLGIVCLVDAGCT